MNRAARFQTSLAPEQILHSGNAGLIIHRAGQLEYEFSHEGRDYSVDLLKYVNEGMVGRMTVFCYEEVFGTRDRLHWLIHMKQPNDYSMLLEMVDHDVDFQDISSKNRLPEKGGGNWERMFVYASLRENIMVPQHGLTHADDDEEQLDTFMPPAHFQTDQPEDVQLNSATAGAIILRTADVKYEFRKESRYFAFDWMRLVNKELAGKVTAYMYEETFGQQDRIHWLIHLRKFEDFGALTKLDRSARARKEIYDIERVHESKGGGTWDKLFAPTTIRDTLMIPHVRQ